MSPFYLAGMRLRVGGRDAYSRMAPAEVADRVGAAGMAALAQALPDPELRRLRESAARWMARGLLAHLAVRKVQIDAEVSANAEEAGRRRTPGTHRTPSAHGARDTAGGWEDGEVGQVGQVGEEWW